MIFFMTVLDEIFRKSSLYEGPCNPLSRDVVTAGATGAVFPDQKYFFKVHLIETRSFEVHVEQIIITI